MSEKLTLAVSPVCPLCPRLLLAVAGRISVQTLYVVGSGATLYEAAWQIAVRKLYPDQYVPFLMARWDGVERPEETLRRMNIEDTPVALQLPSAIRECIQETLEWDRTTKGRHDHELPSLRVGTQWYFGLDGIRKLEDYLEGS